MAVEDFLGPLLKIANEKKATDIHICVGRKAMIRVNGVLFEAEESEFINIKIVDSIINQILTDGQIENLIKNRVIDFSFSKPGLGRFRTNIYSQRGTFAIAIRTLPFEVPNIKDLGLPPIVETFTTKNKGIFLATGVTGSGKSTTLASLLNAINENHSYHVITIEDPIEYLYNHKKALMTQREIGQDADSFASALRAALREDPDVIMVGEMRDRETIQIVLTAAETGHLVFSTLHTVGAAKSIDRIIDAFPPEQHNQVRSQLATVLEGVVSQILIPRKDGTGLVVATEVMIANNAIRNLIREGKHYQINNFIQTGQGDGMHLIEHDLVKLCQNDIVDVETAMLHSQNPKLLTQLLNRR